MNLIIFGPPGAGKGTQSQIISRTLSIPHISTGDMLRAAVAAGKALGKEVAALLAAGQFASDDLIITLVKDRIAQNDCQNGFLLDGFPRSLPQAEALSEAGVPIDLVILFEVTDEQVVERLGGRRVHPGSGRVYHTTKNPPKVVDRDDLTGEPLITREDDQPEVIRRRLQIYRQHTFPLLDYYRLRAAQGYNRFAAVDAGASIQQVGSEVDSILRELQPNR